MTQVLELKLSWQVGQAEAHREDVSDLPSESSVAETYSMGPTDQPPSLVMKRTVTSGFWTLISNPFFSTAVRSYRDLILCCSLGSSE